MKQIATHKKHVLIACAIAGSLSAFAYVNIHANRHLSHYVAEARVSYEKKQDRRAVEDDETTRIPTGILPRTEPIRKALELLERAFGH